MRRRTGPPSGSTSGPRRPPASPALLALLLLGGGGEAHGQQQAAEPPGGARGGERATADDRLPTPEELGLVPGRPRVTPTRTAVPPVLDGVLDDEAWRQAAHLTEFTQQSPIEGAPGTEATDVYVAYDSDNIYFGFHVHYEDVSVMRANRVERDRASMDDLMTVYFDTFLDQQRGYDFDINGYGVQGDGVMSVGRRGFRAGAGTVAQAIPPADRSWDALFESAAQIVDDGYVAEMAIPFKSLRYPAPPEGEPHRWGFQIVREIKGKDQENQVWSPMSRDEASFFAQMGILEGMTEISTSRNLEFLPTFTAVQYGSIDPAVPAFRTGEVDPDAGVNIKYGITSDLTADLTINPDFSQIESDQPQVEVNQRFPLFYSELRPFFLEGAEIFRIDAPVTFVHTRTIVDPDYGAKLSGQVGRLALGVLSANDRAPGRVTNPADPAAGEKARTHIARAQYELYPESNLGAIVTERGFLDGHSRTFGADGNFRLGPTVSSDFRAVGSRLRTPGGETSEGHMLSTRIRQNARNLSWSLSAFQISPDFRTEVGFVRRRDIRTVTGELGYRFWPESWLINWGPTLTYGQNYDYEDVRQDENLAAGLSFNFARFITLSTNLNRDMERYREIDFRKRSFSIRSNVNSNRRYSFGGGVTVGTAIYFAGPFLGDEIRWNVNGTVRPFDRLNSSMRFQRVRFTDPNRGGLEVFEIDIFRATTNLQITDRLGLRNIAEVNSQSKTFDFNLLFNYRVNAGTVIYAGYDDHFMQGDLIEGDRDGDGIEEQLYFTTGKKRTNRAFFVKFQYLLRY